MIILTNLVKIRIKSRFQVPQPEIGGTVQAGKDGDSVGSDGGEGGQTQCATAESRETHLKEYYSP